MSMRCTLHIAQRQYNALRDHLFQADGDEHGAVLKAGLVQVNGQTRLVVKEVHLAVDGVDYLPSRVGYRALAPTFIHRFITQCRDERLVYLAVHNHHGDDRVAFSSIDLESHKRGYPALLDIAKGMPVGALVFAPRAVEADIWMPNGHRLTLDHAVVVGPTLQRLYPHPRAVDLASSKSHDRQLRMFGRKGQAQLARASVGVIGAGGVGSLVCEYLARLGVGEIIVVDPDDIDATNLSRVVGATRDDVKAGLKKVTIAGRHVAEANPAPRLIAIEGDVANDKVAARLRMCDYLFLAADSMRARLVFNALVQQYLIPGVQLGAKIQGEGDSSEFDAWSAIRAVRPADGCLWCNQLIDKTQLAQEAKSDEERRQQAYGTSEPSPSVISLNAVAAAHGVNDFLFDFLALRPTSDGVQYRHLHAVATRPASVHPRRSLTCSECGEGQSSRFGCGDSRQLPTFG